MRKDLRTFLKAAKDRGGDYYAEVKRQLRPVFEPCVLQQKLAYSKRFPVLYCHDIEGSDIPLVTNLIGSYDLIALALDVSEERIEEKGKEAILQRYMERIEHRVPPREVSVSDAPVKDVIIKGDDVDLGILPIVLHAPLDGGKYITIGWMACRDPDTGILNAGVYRHMVFSKSELGFEVSPAHHGGRIAARHAELDKPMEVVIAIGHHPAVLLGSLAEGSQEINEFEVMGSLLGEPVDIVKGETVDLPVPAHSEIVIEGTIDAKNMTTDGPLAEYAHYYGTEMPAYKIQVSAITMRKDAIYHDLDPAHQEHNLAMVLGAESCVYDAVKRTVPRVKAVHFPTSGNCYYHAYVSIEKKVHGEGKAAGMAALVGMPPTKLAVVVDDDIDVYNEHDVLWAISTRVDGEKDIAIIPGVTSDHLDPVCYNEARTGQGDMCTKIIIDATKPLDKPFPTKVSPPEDLWKSMSLKEYIVGE